MMKTLALSLVSFLLVACASPPPKIESRTIAKVEIPPTPKAPDLVPVEDSMRRLDSAVTGAKREMARAEDTLKDSRRMSDHLRKVVDDSFAEADAAAQVALKSIREAAATAAARLDELTGFLADASTALATAESEVELLEIEVSTLKVDLALESSHVTQLAEIARTANARVDEANDQKDEFQNALTTATAQVEIEKAEAARVRGHRFKLILLSSGLLLIVVVLTYLMLRI